MKIFVGEFDLTVNEMLIGSPVAGWMLGSGHKFTIEGVVFGAIPIPSAYKIALIHFDTGVHLATVDVPAGVDTFEEIVQFIQTDVMVPTAEEFEDRGVDAIEKEMLEFEKELVGLIGEKPKISLDVVKPIEPPEYLN